MLSVFTVTAQDDAAPISASPVDWSALTERIVAGLDIPVEFAVLGVKFTGVVRGERHECFGFVRENESTSTPSAVVFANSGIYKDSGSGEKPIHLFNFALKASPSRFARWIDVVRFYGERAGVEIGTVRTKSGGRILTNDYLYTDRDGTPRYRIYRYKLPNGDKNFTQHPVNARGVVIHDRNMDGVTPLPYRLKELPCGTLEDANESAASNRVAASYVFACEGEKTADALITSGVAASTAHGGSGSAAKNWPVIASHFRGLDVVFLPDNDKAGRVVAAIACQSLRDAGAASVRCLALPGLPLKGDAVEWIADGGTAEQLLALADACPLWTAEAAEAIEDDPANRDATLADLRVTLAADAWVWTGWIANSAVNLWAAEPGVGKTRALMDLHRRAYNGLSWPDGEWRPTVDQPKVLWVLADGQYEQMCATAEAFGIPDDAIILNTTGADPQGGSELQTAEQLADLESRIKRVRPAWVVIDTITNTGEFKTQDSVDAKRQYKPLVEIAARNHLPIICVTHLNASGKVLGKRAIERVRVVVKLDQPDPDQPDRRKLWVDKSYAKKPEPLGVTVSDAGYEYDNSPPIAPEAAETQPRKGPAPVKLDGAKLWLAAHLGSQTLPIVEVINAAKEAEPPHTKQTIFRAAEALGLVTDQAARPKTWTRATA